ncbi:MAG TPA: sigma-70 family RNA polymerase sigma factor [Gemmataceae bacterium]|jgi:RNA polymerase sigma-70 factor (ECF subfamily)|nr:sigma-70 family RNA polymerase sigma factor [Gemmataceae bacterium]
MSATALARTRPSKNIYLQDPEVVLMLRVQRDEPGAFAELVARHGQRIFARFFRSFQDRQEAEDLTQDVLLRVYRSRERYQPRAKFATWLFHVTQNVARNAFRRRRRLASMSRNPEFDEQRSPCRLEEGLCSPSRALELSELARGVRAAVSALADRQRAALEMYQFQNRTYAEIAAALALTTKATKSLLYRARIQLKGFLNGLQEI